MRPLCFPKMFNSNNTRVWKASQHVESTQQNCTILLNSRRRELFGDPYFGLTLKNYLFDQNSQVLEDTLIDVIYNQIAIFIPQLKVDRNDINIIRDQEKGKIYIEFSAIDYIDYSTNTYQLVLLENGTTYE
jgi:hypothetical protein